MDVIKYNFKWNLIKKNVYFKKKLFYTKGPLRVELYDPNLIKPVFDLSRCSDAYPNP